MSCTSSCLSAVGVQWRLRRASHDHPITANTGTVTLWDGFVNAVFIWLSWHHRRPVVSDEVSFLSFANSESSCVFNMFMFILFPLLRHFFSQSFTSFLFCCIFTIFYIYIVTFTVTFVVIFSFTWCYLRLLCDFFRLTFPWCLFCLFFLPWSYLWENQSCIHPGLFSPYEGKMWTSSCFSWPSLSCEISSKATPCSDLRFLAAPTDPGAASGPVHPGPSGGRAVGGPAPPGRDPEGALRDKGVRDRRRGASAEEEGGGGGGGQWTPSVHTHAQNIKHMSNKWRHIHVESCALPFSNVCYGQTVAPLAQVHMTGEKKKKHLEKDTFSVCFVQLLFTYIYVPSTHTVHRCPTSGRRG